MSVPRSGTIGLSTPAASASLGLTGAARLYLNYDGKVREALLSHQGTLGFED
ncbi:MAG: hypothetical protein JOY90_08375 [Bradyrhizobium sp.]|nr:hypothetical protein [Bradyrhizobium sp.]